MKNRNIQILILFCTIFLLASCSKDKDENISPALVGKWKDKGTKGSFTIEAFGQKETENLDEAGTGEILEFKADGTVAGEFNGGTINKYKTSGSRLTFNITEDGKTYDFSFVYAVAGNTLTLKIDKALINENITNIAKVDPDSDLAELKEFLQFITAWDQTSTFEKVQ